ncbi:MAG: hypothetical protein C4303_00800 [candidate division GAL15 bacterium]
MSRPVILPKLDMTMEEATVVRWLREEGEWVEAGEPLVEVMTDKVNMEVEAPASGILAGVRARPGDRVPVTGVMAYIVEPGEVLQEEVLATSAGAEQGGGGMVAATPAARRLAREEGIDLATVQGSGPGGRITEVDVRAAVEARRVRGVSEGRRRVVAERMVESAREIPQVHLTRTLDVSHASRARGEVSYTAALVWATARALRENPRLRTTPQGVVHEGIHIGVAVDSPQGLQLVVLRDADRKTLSMLDAELRNLVQRAREDRLTLEDVRDAVFTVSNLGMLGVDRFTSLVVPGQTAILSVGAVRLRPWAVGDALAVRPVCDVTLGLDHRVADGADGARFLESLDRWLQRVGQES